MKKVWSLLCAAALCACGSAGIISGSDAEGQGEGTGVVQVTFQNLSAADVASVAVFYSGPESGTFWLTYDEATGTWGGTLEYVKVGMYTAYAVAYDGSGTEIFRSNSVTFQVKKWNANPPNPPVGVTFILNEVTQPGEFTPPYFISIVRDKVYVEQHESIHIEVQGGGGYGTLTLSGRHAITALPEDVGTFEPAEGMSIVWHPPAREGIAWFVLQLTDELGNMAEMGITVLVGPDRGNANFCASFNLAPTFTVTTRVLNDGDAATAYFKVSFFDDGTAPLDYEWTNDCGMTFHETGYNPASGTISPGSMDVWFKADVPRSSALEECTMTLTVSDFEGAQRILNLNLHTELIIPEIEDGDGP